MKQYIAMLRGINVSGQKPVKMAALKELFEALGFKGVATYIQSGNVVFQARSANSEQVASTIESGIKKTFGFDVAVIVKTSEDVKKVIARCPSFEDEKRVYVTFLKSLPALARVKALALPAKAQDDRFTLSKDVLYVYCPHGYGRSELSNTFFEKQLGVTATTRNWNTVQKLAEMADEMD